MNRRGFIAGAASAAAIRPARSQIFVGTGSASSGAANSVQTQQFFDRLISLPNSSDQQMYANLIDGLQTDGVLSVLDGYLFFAAPDAGTSLTNLVSSSYLATLDLVTGFPTFTPHSGWSNCGAAGMRDVNTNFNPSTAGGQYIQNSAMICGWLIGNTQENRAIITSVSANSHIEIIPLWSDTNTYWAVNGTGTEVASILGLGTAGFWLAQRTGANAQEINMNGAQVATNANASAALDNSNLVTTPLVNTIAMLAWGKSLTAGQKTSIYTRSQTALRAVGAIP